MKIYHAQVNHLENPMGFRMERTVFSWKVKDAEGKKQSYARIRVASDAAMEHLLFDSGEDDKASSLFYPVKLDLEPRTRYYWNVEAGSDAGETAVSEVQFFETGKRNEAWTGKWISCDSKENRHPYFEKEIVPAKEVAKARLYVCGLGLYEVYVDEKRVGDEYLTPYSNDYNEWVQYQTYDVTEEVSKQGMLRVLLGNGWYKARFGFSAFEDKGFYGNEWKLIAELHLTYADGSEEVIGTDESWQVRRSKIAFSNLYDGEHRDDTLSELPLEKAVFCEAPKGELTERMSLPVTIHETFEPKELLHTPAGELVFDMGQEFTGIFKLHVNVPAGTKIHVQTGEILQRGNFYNDNLRSAKSEYIYISDGTEMDLVPHFTFYGYRYVKIEGIPDLKKEDFIMSASVKESRDIRNRIRELGEVNVGSIKEYESVSERYRFLTEQRDDILTAMEELQTIISDMDATIKTKFKENFDQIVENFEVIFHELFGGGHAELRMEDENNPLESGIDIIAQPPGKKLQNMMQMSGGEKALTAIALLFAIQALKPSPFCLLDEIEAALDDSNVSRFASYLNKLTKNTQFIVITHRRGTMTAADRLYGITMQEKGVSTLVSVDLIEHDLN